MRIVIGYDSANEEFIVSDPLDGHGYRMPFDIFKTLWVEITEISLLFTAVIVNYRHFQRIVPFLLRIIYPFPGINFL